MKDWYRNTTWTKEVEEAFFLKYNRARKPDGENSNRLQYLLIQAGYLHRTKDKKLLIVALDLLKKYFDECQTPDGYTGSAFEMLGDIYSEMKKYDLAFENYKKSIDFEKKYWGITNAYLQYSELAVRLNKTELFDYVEQILIEKEGAVDFPYNKYVRNAILSIIYKHKNDLEKAKHYKELAEMEANAQESVFRWHKKLGLVNNRNKLLDKKMNSGT